MNWVYRVDDVNKNQMRQEANTSFEGPSLSLFPMAGSRNSEERKGASDPWIHGVSAQQRQWPPVTISISKRVLVPVPTETHSQPDAS